MKNTGEQKLDVQNSSIWIKDMPCKETTQKKYSDH